MDSSALAGSLLDLIDQREGCDLVRSGEIYPNELVFAKQSKPFLEFVRRDFKSTVAQLELALFQRGVLHLRRERMTRRMTHHPESDRGRNFAAYLFPITEILQSINRAHGSSRPG